MADNGNGSRKSGGSKGAATAPASTTRPASSTKPAPSSMDVEYSHTPKPVTIKSLLEAGAHFGHKTDRWNPKMLPYIFAERNNLHIINLDLTLSYWERARKFITDTVSRGGNILFVGTKDQARDIVKEAALRCGGYYVNTRWLGGTLSNFGTIKNSIGRMRKLEELLRKAEEDSTMKINKRERLSIARQVEKLEKTLGGIREMRKLPDIMFILDVNKEAIAVSEAIGLHIPVVGLVDTNVDPTKVNFPIPSNDDAQLTIKLFLEATADAVIEGKRLYEIQVNQATGGDKPMHSLEEAPAHDERSGIEDSSDEAGISVGGVR